MIFGFEIEKKKNFKDAPFAKFYLKSTQYDVLQFVHTTNWLV